MVVRALKSTDETLWQLDVLGVPFGGPDSRDDDGEYFTAETKFHQERFGLPVPAYYHGLTDNHTLAEVPEYLGKTLSQEVREDGIWYRVLLEKGNALAAKVWAAAKRGAAGASSGTVSHLLRKDEDGRILEWPVIELSLFETDTGKQPANPYAIALPVLKSSYAKAGLSLPIAIDELEEPVDKAEPKEAGDASAEASEDSEELDQPEADPEALLRASLIIDILALEE